MLSWLAGPKPHDHHDPDSTPYVEPPETPAPVFAVRAFKHALFGTPSTQQKQPRRHSNTDTTRALHTTRPRTMRPDTQNDAAAVGKHDEALAPEPFPSPTKGILLTPGTAGGKRKTVSFGVHVADNEEKRPLKSGLPDDCPGKFPSPWAEWHVDPAEGAGDQPRGRSKLTEALEQVRDESTRRKVKLGGRDHPRDDGELTQDLADPKSDAGKYWKTEYDMYRENTVREVKKLVTKQKSAKNFARLKDEENQELKEELRQERKVVERLEKRSRELEKQLMAFQEELQQAHHGERSAKEELDRLKRGLGNPRCRRPNAPATSPSEQLEAERKDGKTNFAHPATLPPPEAVKAPPVPPKDPAKDMTKPAVRENMARPRPRPNDMPTKPDHIWGPTQSEAPPPSPRGSRAVTSGTAVTPLHSLSIDGVPDPRSVAMSMGLQPHSPPREKRTDSPMRQSPNPSQPVASLTEPVSRDQVPRQVPPSSPFDSTAGVPPMDPSPIHTASAAARRARTGGGNTKENLSPPRPKARDGVSPNPSATWTGLGGSIAEQNRSLNRKEGKRFSTTAAERARARQAAKGRVPS